MRKADYQTLALQIRTHLAAARIKRDESPDLQQSQAGTAQVLALESLAADLARRISVEPRAFLQSCGV